MDSLVVISIIRVLSYYTFCTLCDQTFIGLITPRELLSNYLLHLCIISLSGSASFQPCELKYLESLVFSRIISSSILLSNIIYVSGTLRPDRRHCLASRRLENNICHVVDACELLARELWYRVHTCGGPWLNHDSICKHSQEEIQVDSYESSTHL